ncbi:mitochondrial mRNA pseudouridine synthase RPUSD3 isoform X1 [Ochotona curzoniae]|uniref:mitochondrial mRNA pseudouridine synthase RPUSD3 isoform X1 n=1 Tax=Ochotona curzoniae TaxID=130825 RepID=UPI001B34DCD6|nr:mitochondrial mRNA pseudouridine synthase RPUSD3 isoform X1 [Ochotona curzoniae]
MRVCGVWGRVLGGWRRGIGLRTETRDAGFGSEARHQPHPQGPYWASGPLGEQPFPGLQWSEGLSREELVDVLREAVVDQRGPLVALNKPQGLPVTGKPGELTLVSVLPELSQCLALGASTLQVVQAPGKEASGLVLLSSCPQTAGFLYKFFTQARRTQRPTATYWAVTHGVPATREGKIQTALRLQEIDGVRLVIPVKSPTRKDILANVKRTLSYFYVVATGSGCALVQLQPLTGFPRQLQVHMTLQLCPVLGDHIHSARVGTVLGQRFLLPAETTKPRRQVLDAALLQRLRLTPSQAAQLPLHLHLHRLLLPGTGPKDAPIQLVAPLPTYFSRTLQRLGLRHQEPSLCP